MGKETAAWVHEMYRNVSSEDLAAGRKAMAASSVGGKVPKVYSRGRGAKYWTSDGMEYIDCTAQAWSLGVGACHPVVIDAVKAQLDYFTHVRTNFDTVPKLMLSKKLAELAPGTLGKIAYSLHGTTAVEGAMKVALRNRPGRKYFLSLWDSYFGRSFATMDISYPHPVPFLHYTGNRLRLPPLSPLLPRLHLVTFGDNKSNRTKMLFIINIFTCFVNTDPYNKSRFGCLLHCHLNYFC